MFECNGCPLEDLTKPMFSNFVQEVRHEEILGVFGFDRFDCYPHFYSAYNAVTSGRPIKKEHLRQYDKMFYASVCNN